MCDNKKQTDDGVQALYDLAHTLSDVYPVQELERGMLVWCGKILYKIKDIKQVGLGIEIAVVWSGIGPEHTEPKKPSYIMGAGFRATFNVVGILHGSYLIPIAKALNIKRIDINMCDNKKQTDGTEKLVDEFKAAVRSKGKRPCIWLNAAEGACIILLGDLGKFVPFKALNFCGWLMEQVEKGRKKEARLEAEADSLILLWQQVFRLCKEEGLSSGCACPTNENLVACMKAHRHTRALHRKEHK